MKPRVRGYCQNEVWLSIGIWVRLFIHVYTFGFLIFLAWHLKQQNRSVCVEIFPLFYLFGHISFNKLSSSETTMKVVMFLKVSGDQGRVPFTHVSHTKGPQVSSLQHLLGESFALNSLFAPHLASGRITFLGHSLQFCVIWSFFGDLGHAIPIWEEAANWSQILIGMKLSF